MYIEKNLENKNICCFFCRHIVEYPRNYYLIGRYSTNNHGTKRKERRKRTMLKTIALLFLIGVVSVAGSTNSFGVRSKFIEVETVPTDVGLDWCPDCVNTMDQLVSTVLNIILQGGVVDTCGHLCDLVAQDTGSGLLGFICTMGCDFLGLEEFVNLIQEADINPIYYCEKMNICPSKNRKDND